MNLNSLDFIKETCSKKRILNSAFLKWIAIITMLIDHIGATLVLQYLYDFRDHGLQPNCTQQDYQVYLAEFEKIKDIYYVFRSVGRIAFPIFCFLIVTGFFHTRNVWKYLGRLTVFCLLSEIPFNLAFSNEWIDLEGRNVFFTLAIGLLVLIGLQFITEHVKKVVFRYPLSLLVMISGIYLAEVLKTDYAGPGVALVIVFYLFYNMPIFRDISFIMVIVYMVTKGGTLWIEYFALADIILFHLYNGKKGKNLPKMFFYLFYPVHLLLLAILVKLCF